MSLLYLVRHGEAAASWYEAHDPGLSPQGHKQAQRVREELAPLGPLSIVTSPLMRARETAEPLLGLWKREAVVDPRVGEIPSPVLELQGRTAWLREVMARRWPELGAELQAWRRQVLETLCEVTEDTVIFTHFVVINVAFGHAAGDDRVLSFWPRNGSITVLENRGAALLLVKQGAQGAGSIL